MKLFQGGMSWDEVATTLGVSSGFLYRVRNIYLPNTIRQKNKWTQETDKMCISLSQRGASFAELYEALPSYSRDYIRERVAKLGLSFVKTRAKRERATTKAELRKMLKQGDSNILIAQKIGCSSDHVGRLISQFGLRRTDADLSLMRSRMNKERRARKDLLAKTEEPKEDRKSVQYFEDKLQKLEEQRIAAIGTSRFHSLTGEINALRIKIAVLKQTIKPSAIERDNLC